MINYITIGTNDLEHARSFYDELFGQYGVPRIHDDERFSFYSNGTSPGIMLTRPYNGEPATVGNGSMIALQAESAEQVDAVYQKAITLGASCEGEPGDRGEGTSYGAYFRDLDGNKIAVIHLLLG
jgi:predicted lactoylglutathione lyase